MRHGPWTDDKEIWIEAQKGFRKLRSITGKAPVSVEMDKDRDRARVLFENPEGREPSRVKYFAPYPTYHWDGRD